MSMYYEILRIFAECFANAENILLWFVVAIPSMLSLHISCRAVYIIAHFLKRFLWGGSFSDLAIPSSSGRGSSSKGSSGNGN